MANAFNLTAQINLQGPANLKPIVNRIRKEMQSAVKADVKINIDGSSAKSIGNVTAKLKAMNVALVEAKGHVGSLNSAFAKMSSSLSSLGNTTKTVGSNFNQINKHTAQVTQGLKETTNNMENLGRSVARNIKQFAAFGIASTAVYGLVNAVNDAYKSFLQFDRELVRLEQITGSGAVAIGNLSNKITELSTNLGVSSTELAKVAVTLSQAGFTASQTTVALGALAKSDLAPSFENLTKTTEGAIAAMRQFNIGAGELEAALGSINAVASKFAVESADIIAAIQRTGGVFASASNGVSEGKDALNEFIAVFTSVRATTRESGESIATGLRTIFTRIQRGSTIEYLKEFNIELQDSEGKFVGAYEAIKRLSEGLKGLDTRDVRFTRIVEELGGFRQIGKVIPLIQEFGTAQEALKVAQQGQDTLTDAAATAQKSLVVQLAKVKEQFDALVRSIAGSNTFQALLGTTLALTRGLLGLANVFKPILPIIAAMGALKLGSAAINVGKGIMGGFGKGGKSQSGVETPYANPGRSTNDAAKTAQSRLVDSLVRSYASTDRNTAAIQQLTTAVNTLAQKMNTGGSSSSILGPDGKPLKFARGGVVPGSGSGDTVPAMLTPGEFVIRKDAVKALGTEKLHKMNKYSTGGGILDVDTIGAAVLGNKNSKQSGTQGIKDEITVSYIVEQVGKESKAAVEQVFSEANKSNKTYDLKKEVVAPEIREKIDIAIEKASIQSLKILSDHLKEEGLTNIESSSNANKDNFIRSLNEGVRGNLFEQALTGIQNQGTWSDTPDPQAPFDFIGPFNDQLAKLFPNIKDIKYKDAKATLQAASKENMAKKIGNQAIRGADPSSILQGELKRIYNELKRAGAPLSWPSFFKGTQTNPATIKKQAEKFPNIFRFQKGAKHNDPLQVSLLDETVKLAKGGYAKDTVPAMLTPGEFVINKEAASRIGSAQLNRMNKADKVQGFNKGGPVGFVQRFRFGGDVVGGLGYPGSHVPSPERSYKTAAEALAWLEKNARNAGMSFQRYQKSIKAEIATRAQQKINNRINKRDEIGSFIVRNRSEIKKANFGSTEIQNFVSGLTEKIRSMDINIPTERIELEMQSLVNDLKRGIPLEEIIARSDVLDRVYNDSYDAAEALAEAHRELEIATGHLTDEMKVSEEELKSKNYKDSGQAESDFGLLGQLMPEFAMKMSQKSDNNIVKGSQDILSLSFLPVVGKSLGKLNDQLKDSQGPMADLIRGMGGFAGVAATGISVMGSQLPKLFKSLGLGQNAYAAGTAKALEKGGSMAASFGVLGGQLGGAPGAVAGLIGGAVVGAISGFAEGFRTKTLENKIGELNETMTKVDEAFKNLEKSRNERTIKAVQDSLGGFRQNYQNLESEGNRDTWEALTSTQGVAGIGTTAAGLGLAGLGVAKLAGAVGGTALTGPLLAGLTVPVAWMGVVDIVAGLGVAIGGLWATASSFNPDEIDDEAFKAALDAASSYVEGLSRLADQQINLKSLEEISNVLTPVEAELDTIDKDLENKRIDKKEADARTKAVYQRVGEISGPVEQAIQSELGRAGYNVDLSQPIQEQIDKYGGNAQAIADDAKRAVAKAAALAEIDKIYGNNTPMARAKKTEMEKDGTLESRGFELLGQQEVARQKQAELAAVYRQTRVEVENLVDQIDKVNAQIDRFGTELGRIGREAENISNISSGKAKLQAPSRENEEMLRNMRAYSDAELSPIIEQVRRTVGGEQGDNLASGLEARRILQENLPTILANTTQEDIGSVTKQISELFNQAGLSPELASQFSNQVEQSLQNEQGSRQGKSFQELSQEFPALQESMNLIQRQYDTSANALKKMNDAIEQSNEIITQWGESLEQARQYQLAAAKAQADAMKKLTTAKGGYVGTADQTRGFIEEIKSLTDGEGVDPNNMILVDTIKTSYDDLRQQIKAQEQAVLNSSTQEERTKQTKALDELNRKANNRYEALQEIAKNTEFLDGIINAIGINRQRSEAGGRFVESMFTASAAELSEIAYDLSNYSRLMTGDPATQSRYFDNNPEARKSAARGMNYIVDTGMFGEEENTRMRARAQMEMLKYIRTTTGNEDFGKDKLVTMIQYDDKTGGTKDGGKISLEDAIKARMSGTYKDPLEERAAHAIRLQMKANDHLALIAANTAKQFDMLAKSIDNMVLNLPDKIAEALNRAKTESEAEEGTQPGAPGSGGGGEAPITPPPEPEIFGDPDIAKIRADLDATSQATGEAMRDLQKIRDRREGLWFDLVGPYPEEVELGEKIVALKQKELALQQKLEEAIKKQMDKQREEAGYTPLPPSDEEINKLQQQYDNTVIATEKAFSELEKYKTANPGSKTGPYPGYPRGRSTPEREKLEAKARAAELVEIEASNRLDAAIREKEQYRQKEKEEFNIPPEWEPEKSPVENPPPPPPLPPTPPVSNEPLPVTLREPIEPIEYPMPGWAQRILEQPIIPPVAQPGVGIGTGVGCCGTLEELLDEVKLIKTSLVTTTFLMDIGSSIKTAMDSVRVPVYIEPSSKDFLNTFNSNFNSYVTRLENAFPSEITLNARHTVDVNLNGAEMFESLEGSLQSIIITEVDKKMSTEFDRYLEQNGMPPRRTNGTNPSGPRP